jgi:hypothetical protein
MAYLAKALHIVHRTRVMPGKTVNFAVTPYEGGGNGVIYNSPSGGFLAGPRAGTDPDYPYPIEFGAARPDAKLLSFKGSGMGFTFTHQVRGKSPNYNQFKGNRGLRTEIYEMKDADDSDWRCYSGGHVASSIILPQGVTARRGNNGEDILTIQSATPDAFLANLSLPQMPYILAGPANKERDAWRNLVNRASGDDGTMVVQKELGYRLSGQGQGGLADGNYVDPFAGFATYRDQYLLSAGQLMQPVAANEQHFLDKLSSSRALVEILANHVKANGNAISQTFNMEILSNEDIESDLLHFELSGSINSIKQEAAQHGVWRAWWDSKSNFHFVPDYYTGYNTGKVAITLNDGPSLIGELEVMLGTPEKRINRVAVRPNIYEFWRRRNRPGNQLLQHGVRGGIPPWHRFRWHGVRYCDGQLHGQGRGNPGPSPL